MITTPALAAAFRVATSSPRHQHEWRPPAPSQIDAAALRKDALARRELVRELLAEGLTQRGIAARLEVSRTTVFKHVRAIKAERRRGIAR